MVGPYENEIEKLRYDQSVDTFYVNDRHDTPNTVNTIIMGPYINMKSIHHSRVKEEQRAIPSFPSLNSLQGRHQQPS